jgi:DNA mismatch endonuclease (patch repair protein)
MKDQKEVSQARRRNMQAIRSQNTKPELLVRRLAHRLGYRFRLHRRDLPGKPDLVFPRLKKAILVHGCFWHSHSETSCPLVHAPKTNRSYWAPKLAKNMARDTATVTALTFQGWRVLIVWECQTRNELLLSSLLSEFLSTEAIAKTSPSILTGG